MKLSEKFAEVLQAAWLEDPQAIDDLLSRRVQANGLGDATPIVVRGFPPDQTVSALGLINGLLASSDGGRVAVICNPDGRIIEIAASHLIKSETP